MVFQIPSFNFNLCLIVKAKSWIKALNESFTAAIFIWKNAIISTLLVCYHIAKARQTVDSIVKCVLLVHIYLYTSIVQIFCKNLIKPYEKFTYPRKMRFFPLRLAHSLTFSILHIYLFHEVSCLLYTFFIYFYQLFFFHLLQRHTCKRLWHLLGWHYCQNSSYAIKCL